MKKRKLLNRIRLLIYAGLGLFTVYLVLRFDVISMSKDGSSPLLEFEPGTRLFVDRWFGEPEMGDAVLFEGPGEVLLLGRVTRPPATASEDVWRVCEDGALWIEGDRPGHPVRDSRILGPIARDRVRARVRFGLRW